MENWTNKLYDCIKERRAVWRGDIVVKVTNIANINKFIEVIDRCEGKVELVTEHGDRLNLKSKISQFVSLTNIVKDGHIPQVEIIPYDKNDREKLMKFMLNGYF